MEPTWSGVRRRISGSSGSSPGSPPGGTLLVIAHHYDNLTDGVGGPQDPAVLYSERDVIADLGVIDCSAIVERAERVARPVLGTDRPALDTVVRARKLGPDG